MSMPEPCPKLAEITDEHIKNCMLCKCNMTRLIMNLEKQLREIS